MEPSKSFTDLIVWQKAHELVLNIYKVTESFPNHELYGLTSQLRRAMVSVPANIAEGFKRTGLADKNRFLNIAQGSLEESKYFLILAKDLGYFNSEVLFQKLEEVGKVLEAYNRSIKRKRFNK